MALTPPTSGHTRALRLALMHARLQKGWSAQKVADKIAEELGLKSFSGQAVLWYEKFKRHPPIDKFAAWARVLDHRLVVELDDAHHPRYVVLLMTTEACEVARMVDIAPPEKRAALLAMMRGLTS